MFGFLGIWLGLVRVGGEAVRGGGMGMRGGGMGVR